ncbi:hypothetical protein GQ53DRAFT_433247 [Thozetella sp. PMI_491]|nr:hypothetical protein GQ53DRAFT_433247 [Thozetella sp. PMI_491]
MASSHRWLLPKASGSAEADQHGPPDQDQAIPRTLNRTAHACNVCRRRKIKCDGHQSECSPCINAGLVCSYSVPRQRTLDEEACRDLTLFNMLRTLPDEKATELLQAVRAGTVTWDAWEVPNYDPALAEDTSLRNLLATRQGILEFEPTIQHPICYPPLFPLPPASPQLEMLLRPARTLESQLPTSLGYPPEMLAACDFLEAPLADERLPQLEMKNRTVVSVSNDLAAEDHIPLPRN